MEAGVECLELISSVRLEIYLVDKSNHEGLRTIFEKK